MYLSYNSQKVVHDQMIQEALEHHRLNDEQAPHRERLCQIVGRIRALFTTQARRKQARPLPSSAQGESPMFYR